MGLLEYILLAVTSLFVILDPIAVVPAFLGMTPNDSTEARVRMARLASIVAGCVLVFFVVVGEGLFKILGITMSAFKIAGSIVLLLIAMDMLRAQRSAVVETNEETAAGAQKDDIAHYAAGNPDAGGPGSDLDGGAIANRGAGNSVHPGADRVHCAGLSGNVLDTQIGGGAWGKILHADCNEVNDANYGIAARGTSDPVHPGRNF